jgi:hypothetical protein
MEIHPVDEISTRDWLDFPPSAPKWLDGNPTILKPYGQTGGEGTKGRLLFVEFVLEF